MTGPYLNPKIQRPVHRCWNAQHPFPGSILIRAHIQKSCHVSFKIVQPNPKVLISLQAGWFRWASHFNPKNAGYWQISIANPSFITFGMVLECPSHLVGCGLCSLFLTTCSVVYCYCPSMTVESLPGVTYSVKSLLCLTPYWYCTGPDAKIHSYQLFGSCENQLFNTMVWFWSTTLQ